MISQIRNRKNKQKKEPVNAIISANDNGGTISYTYYPDGKVKTITSPGGAVTSMQYDIAGNQTQLNDPSAGTINYTYDGFGQLLTQTNARSQQTTMSYLPDGRINSKTTPEGTYSYTYNTNKQLSGVTSPSSISRGGTTILNMAYSNNGNITTKSDIGTSFEYSNSSRPYAITNVSTSSGIIPLTTQTITYNSFEKINSITEGQFNANFVYNSDNERCKMEMLQNGTSVLTRWYIGSNYIKEQTGSTVKEYSFIGGDAYTAPVVAVKTGTVTIWYSLLRDNLGSITHVVDSLNNVSEYSYDAWGRRRNPVNWNYDLTGQPNLLAGRGFTGHETMTEFGLINMNGRLYDPAVGRFLSPDPYVQAPDFTQNLNRYAYGLNNPLKYNDPSGEFLNLLIGAIIVGVINWVTHGAELNIEGLGYFGVGVFAGALGAGVGTGISSIMAGGTFGAGFIGSSAAMMATTSFATNAAIGSGALFSAGFTNGLGNGLMGGQNFGQALGSGFNDGLIGGVSGGLIDGIAGGIDAAIDGRRFFDGATVRDQVLANQNIPIIGQRGDNNCLPASAEAVDKSLGGNMTQEQVRALPGLGGDPNTVPLGDVDVWEKYASASKHTLNGEVGKPSSYYKIIGDMSKGGRVAINLNTGNVGHSVVMQRVVERTITKISGKILPKNLYYVMNPGNGGSITRISARSISNALHIFSIFP